MVKFKFFLKNSAVFIELDNSHLYFLGVCDFRVTLLSSSSKFVFNGEPNKFIFGL